MRARPTSVREPALERGNLTGDEVHLWWGRLGAVESLDAVRGWLSDDELRRAERFRWERDARAFLFRRAFLRRVLATHVGCGPAELVFDHGPHGRPQLVGGDGELCFNAASRAGLALIGLTRGRALGVDVEAFPAPPFADPEELARLVRRVATAFEQAALARLPADERPHAFALLWTRKEAALKALGTGLSREPNTLTVGLADDEGAPLFPAPLETRWLVCAPPAGFVASVVVAAERGESIVLRSATLA